MGPPHKCRETVVGRASVPALAQLLQWGRRTNAAKRWWGGPPCPPWRSSFNGPAARMPRNGGGAGLRARPGAAASMGPPHECRETAGPSPLTRGSPSAEHHLPPAARSIPAHAGQPRCTCPPCGQAAVHPRSRGAAVSGKAVTLTGWGPSPLTRGSRRQRVVALVAHRSIPAHAGQPASGRNRDDAPRVHPRSRGAASSSSLTGRWRGGPSPLTRGSRGQLRDVDLGQRSIPAHAGQPRDDVIDSRECQVHPRSRGAAISAPVSPTVAQGPSPLTRGSPILRLEFFGSSRSIPAHAGQPTRCRPRTCRRWVHPRSRGAASTPPPGSAALGGPSPLTRGSPALLRRLAGLARSIPAHAGQPIALVEALTVVPVHPRSRGAALTCVRQRERSPGPSPLTRGSRARESARRASERSIPAHAGQPRAGPATCQRAPVHPRSRGAADPVVATAAPTEGPSPLTRGSRRPVVVPADERGSIPAHAGQPSKTYRRTPA